MKKILIASAFVSALTVLSTVVSAQECSEACMMEIAQQYLRDASAQDPSMLPWADRVRYTENNVAMMIGDGFWGAGPAVRTGIMVADEDTGNVVWLGITSEHGQEAYHGLRLHIKDGLIDEVESYLGREGTPDLFAATADYRINPGFTSDNDRRQNRRRLIGIVDDYFDSKQANDGDVSTPFSDGCTRITNGVDVTFGDIWSAQAAEGCEAQLEIGVYKPAERIRARRFPVVDEERGVVVALSLEDHPVRFTEYETTDGQTLNVEVEYPNTRGMLELFKIVEGEITRIEGVSVFLPYYIHDLWAQ